MYNKIIIGFKFEPHEADISRRSNPPVARIGNEERVLMKFLFNSLWKKKNHLDLDRIIYQI